MSFDSTCAFPGPDLAAPAAAGLISCPRCNGLRALDLGCGHGTEAIQLAKMGFAVTAVDANGGDLDIAKQRSKKARTSSRADFIKHDALTFRDPKGPAQFQVIVDRFLNSHLDDDNSRYELVKTRCGSTFQPPWLTINATAAPCCHKRDASW